MRRWIVILLVLLMAGPVLAQGHGRGKRFGSEGIYFVIGGTLGPTFSNFFDYVNSKYDPVKRLGNFGSNVSFAFGYISRFHRNFGVDAGVSFYGLKSAGIFTDPNSVIPEMKLNRRIEYNTAVFTATLPVYLEFGPRQPVVPYVGVGISIFSMTFDDYFGDYALRDTRTAVGGHFEAGMGIKLTPRMWLDLRGRWHSGNGHLSTVNDISPGLSFKDFTIKQNISQYAIGVDYFFR